MVWPRSKVFWLSKDNPTRHSERKKKKRQTDEEVGRLLISKSGQEWNLLAQLGQLKGIVANSSVVTRRPSKVMG